MPTNLFEDLFLGIVQGITEWLPISSKGINTLIQSYFSRAPLAEALKFSIWLHIGTLLAASVYFRSDIAGLLRQMPQYFREPGTGTEAERRSLIRFLVVSTTITGFIGFPLMVIGLNDVEVSPAAMMAVVGLFLMISGVVQRYAQGFSGSRVRPGARDAVFLGMVQASSIIPGISRSGVTTSTLLLRGFDASQALRISFLMSIPTVAGAAVGLGLVGEASFRLSALLGVLAAFLVGLVTIRALLRAAARFRFWKLCLLLGGLSLVPLMIEAFQLTTGAL